MNEIRPDCGIPCQEIIRFGLCFQDANEKEKVLLIPDDNKQQMHIFHPILEQELEYNHIYFVKVSIFDEFLVPEFFEDLKIELNTQELTQGQGVNALKVCLEFYFKSLQTYLTRKKIGTNSKR